MRCFSLLIFILLFSCRGTYRDRKLLHEAEAIFDSIPKEALSKLQAIQRSEYFSDADHAKYSLLFTKAMLIVGNKLPSDSLINHAVAYYHKTGDSIATFEALYTKGRYFFSVAKYDSALHNFSLAEATIPRVAYSEKCMLTQRISGFSNLYLGDTKAAIKNLQAVRNMVPDTDTVNQIYALMNLGQAYGYDKKRDSATHVYRQALHLAQKLEEVQSQSAILNQLSNLYAQEKDFQKALEYKKQEHSLRANRKEIPSRNLAQAMLFDKQNMPDSARRYLKLAIGGNDNVVADIAYSFLSDWYQKQGLYEEAFSTRQKRGETARYLASDINMASLQHQYEKERLKNENNLLKIKEKEKNIVLMATLLSVLLLAIIAYIFLVQTKRKRDRERFVLKERQLNNENILLKKEREISHLREKEALLRESIFRRITFSGKIPSLHPGENNKKVSSTNCLKIVLSEMDWKNLEENVNEAYPHFTQHLRNEYPGLTEEDIRFCCLLKINVNMQDLSDIYCVTKAAITKRKYRIKTDKMHLYDNTTDLDTFLRNFYE